MIVTNQNKITDKKIKNKPGGLANESRMGGYERELRKRKVIRVGSVSTSESIKFEQAWNRQSIKRDAVKITLGDEYIIVERDELEQALAFMAQGFETIKFTAPNPI